ncbi:tRNA adenosine deaminase-associated protein [Actinomadura sp. HBU206391]|uniref:tRNA adenosine deaminase-associated protein n=1 Tax=Actinomadura sp. HBU206391 TaxID=2731692 RepID=UPI00165082BC|nr:tRNA adenosine deaminase-associated protein [Actinomadura sp. HBU206391]MBC6456422.1 tRNA adenosine deaminase-associated protein [Actinomadura sp. HBU206391]
MPYFAAVFARTEQGWLGTETELAEAEGIDDVADVMREVAMETTGDPVLLLLEEDDQWFAVIRMDDQDEPRVFVSDSAAGLTSDLAGLLSQSVGETPLDGDASGDADLLDDLGVDAKRLLELSERALPGDALLTVAEQTGFAEEFDRLRD